MISHNDAACHGWPGKQASGADIRRQIKKELGGEST